MNEHTKTLNGETTMNTGFTTENVNLEGTSLQGYITCSYDTLCEVFGQPEGGDGHKTQAEWAVKTDDGTVFAIYDWKEHKPVYDVTEWNIGGKTTQAVEALHTIVNAALDERAKYAVRIETLRHF